jgi:riboflavin synthase
LFTGLIDDLGTVRSTGRTLIIATALADAVGEGDSVSVDGACLSVVEVEDGICSFEVSPETISRTIAGSYKKGSRVNLELPVGVDERLEGHLVQGHVDGVAQVLEVRKRNVGCEIRLSRSAGAEGLIVEKGSIALNGISLTVASVVADGIWLALIPQTLRRTNAGEWRAGTRVNVEFDILGKYVQEYMRRAKADESLRRVMEEGP